jgi:hypothetical protein
MYSRMYTKFQINQEERKKEKKRSKKKRLFGNKIKRL